MLSIKLRPVGRKGQRSFRVAVMEKRSKLKGKFIEDVGWVNPHSNELRVDEERARYWISVGAKPTDSVHNALVKAGVIKGPKRPVHKTSKKKEEEPKAEKEQKAAAEADTAESGQEEVSAEEKEKEAKTEEGSEEKQEEKPEEAPPEDK